jgi:hypothetical protein
VDVIIGDLTIWTEWSWDLVLVHMLKSCATYQRWYIFTRGFHFHYQCWHFFSMVVDSSCSCILVCNQIWLSSNLKQIVYNRSFTLQTSNPNIYDFISNKEKYVIFLLNPALNNCKLSLTCPAPVWIYDLKFIGQIGVLPDEMNGYLCCLMWIHTCYLHFLGR